MKLKSEILRQKAEAILQKNPFPHGSLTEAEMLNLIHELEVHQTELQLLLQISGEELSFEIREKAQRAEEILLANKELAFQYEEKKHRADELAIANIELQFQNDEKSKRAAELLVANKELAYQNGEKTRRANELNLANIELHFQNDEKAKRAAELLVANKELAYQNGEKTHRANELNLANIELQFQNDEKAKRAAELIVANKELLFQNDEKTDRANELNLANIELQFQNDEKANRAAELVLANKELAFQNDEKAKRAAELLVANRELAYQNDEKTDRANELNLANIELQFQNDEKAKRAEELVVANKELLFQKDEKKHRADELAIANIELLFQNDEKNDRENELNLANIELRFQSDEKAKRAAELVVANKELAFQNEEKAKRAAELIVANKEFLSQNEEKTNQANNLSLANIDLRHQNDEKAKQTDELTIANKLISNQRDRLEEIASLVPGVVYQYRLRPDGSSCFPYASEAIRQIYRVTPEEVREDATKAFSNIHPDDFDGMVASIQSSAKELTSWEHEYRVKFDDGTIRNLFGNALPQSEEDGSVLWHGFITDISERKKAEDELKLLSARLSLATVTGGIGIWEYDLVNNTLLWDDQMFALYGIKAGEFGGVYEAWRAGLHPDDAEQGELEIQMALSGQKEFDTEFRVVWPDQSVHSIKATAIVKRDESGKAVNMVGTNWDITLHKDAELALSKARNEAEAANRSKSLFLANISHEIRTPLNAIIGFSQLLNREQLTDRQNDYSVSIHRSGEHLLELLNDILELSKIEAGREVLNPANIDFHALFADVKMMFSIQAQSKQLQLIFETCDDFPQYLIVDENKLRQILINLIGNALKFTESGGIAVRARIKRQDGPNSQLQIEIQDSGIGIAEMEIGKLFTQFEQGSAGIKQSSGTGLGLALSRELAILMGGNITVESKEGEGSVFTIRVEIKEVKPQAGEYLISKRVKGIYMPKHTYRVLVVDDKEENLRAVVDFLHLAGFETNEAVNGVEAIAKFESWSPHLVLIDIRMPVMDGYEATRRIKATEKGKETPFIALSAGSFDEEQKNEAGFHFQGYIRKPFRESELFNTIAMVLGIQYMYEEAKTTDSPSGYQQNPETIDADISMLPKHIAAQIHHAVKVADFQLLKKLFGTIENPELRQHLVAKAKKFDLDYFQKLLNN